MKSSLYSDEMLETMIIAIILRYKRPIILLKNNGVEARSTTTQLESLNPQRAEQIASLSGVTTPLR